MGRVSTTASISQEWKHTCNRIASPLRRYRVAMAQWFSRISVVGSGGLAEDAEDIMTNPDDYFFVPPRDEGDNFSDGNDYWETV